MRRVTSIILFVLGGWFLSSEAMIAWINFGVDAGGQLAVIAIIAVFAAPFLLLGAWASPGNRFAELGLTLMIVAGIGAMMAGVLAMIMYDPGFKDMMPPDQPMPKFDFSPVVGALNLLLVGGGGYLLRRWAVARTGDQKPDLEQVFD